MSCSNNITPCGCGSNPCGCGTSSNDVVYQGPNLSCTGVTNCDTVTEAISTIDGFICSPEMVQNIINNILNNPNLYNQFTSIVNNTVDCQTVWNCLASTTTTTTTAIPCVCTTYFTAGSMFNPGAVTYVPCGATQVVTIQVTDIVEEICVDNTYGVIATGSASFNNTFDCCVASTTTTTTLAPTTTTTTTSLAYCYTLTAEGKVSFYWIDVNGVAQTITITNNVTYVCAQLGSVVANGAGEIDGGITLCTNNSQCVPTTTTTTTTAITSICFCIHSEGGGCAYSIELPILGNAPFQNGRPVYNITGDANGTVYYDGSQWIYDSVENSPLLQPLLNSSYYPIGTYSEWGGVDTTYFMNSSTSGPCPTTTTTSSSSTSTSTSTSTTTSSSSTTTTTTTAEPTTTTTTTKGTESCSKYKLIASGPSVEPGDTDWSGIDCTTGLPVGGTVSDLANTTTGCIVDGSLVLGSKVSIVETVSCAVFELEPTCCGIGEREYVPLLSSTVIGSVVYATNGYCYSVVGTSLLSPTLTVAENFTYDDCSECTTAHPCPTTTTTTTTI